MTEPQRPGFWKRLKDRLTQRTKSDPPPSPDSTQPTNSQLDPKPDTLNPSPNPQPDQDKSHRTQSEEQTASPASKDRPTDQPTPPAAEQEPPGPDKPASPPDLESITPTPDAREPRVLSTSELKTDRVGRVYAEALLELADEANAVDTIADQLADLLPILDAEGELHRLLINPAIADAERGAIVKRVFEGKVHPLLFKMLRVLGDKGRLGSLPEVASGYLLAVAEQRGQVDVIAYVASALEPDESVRVAEQIGTALGKRVTLTQKVDPSLIGGMKIKVGDRLIDASVASQLRTLKNKIIAAGRS